MIFVEDVDAVADAAFVGGGGRAGAAGIDLLARDRLQEFIRAFGAAFDPGHGQIRA